MKKKEQKFIGFPPPYLGYEPIRLRVLYNDKNVLAIEKLVGALVDGHPWYEGEPSIVDGIRRQLVRGKPELAEYNMEEVYGVYGLEPEVTGVALIAKSKEAVTSLRNEFGSESFKFRFLLLAEAAEGDEERECNLPLAKHLEESRMMVSHKTGKKSQTFFKRIERLGRYDLWEAFVHSFRMHQVRLHAHEVGIRVVGENLYANVEPMYLSKVKKRGYVQKWDEERPLTEGICVHLDAVELRLVDQEALVVRAPLTHKWEVALKKLRKSVGR